MPILTPSSRSGTWRHSLAADRVTIKRAASSFSRSPATGPGSVERQLVFVVAADGAVDRSEVRHPRLPGRQVDRSAGLAAHADRGAWATQDIDALDEGRDVGVVRLVVNRSANARNVKSPFPQRCRSAIAASITRSRGSDSARGCLLRALSTILVSTCSNKTPFHRGTLFHS